MNKPLTHPLSAGPLDSGHRYPLTLAQKRIWALGQIGNATVFPNQAIALRWAAGITVDQVTQALSELTHRHAALRTRFVRLAGGRIESFSDPSEAPSIEIMTTATDPSSLSNVVSSFAERGFDLLRESTSRSLLFTDSDGRVCSATVLHAIVCDIAGAQALRQSLFGLLAGDNGSVADDLVLVAGQQEQDWLETSACCEATAYWRGLIGEDYVATTLPTRFNAVGHAGTERRRIPFSIPAKVWSSLRAWATGHGIEDDTALAAAFAAVLVRCSGSAALQMGILSAAAAQPQAAVRRSEQIVPLKLAVESRQTMTGLCAAIAAAREDAVANAAAYEHILAAIQTHEERAQEAIVKSLFEVRSAAPSGDSAEDLLPSMLPRPDVEFAFVVQPNASGGLDGLIDYADGLYDHRLVARAAIHFERTLAQMAARPELRIKDIELVSAGELDTLSAPYEDLETNDDRAVHQHISAHAQRNPDKTAIIYADEIWSHGKVETAANQLAHHLIALGVDAEVIVATAIKRSPEAVVAILATLKAGGAYIPVEPDHPQTRNHHILRDGGVKVILTNSWLLDRIPDGLDATVLELDKLDLTNEPQHAPDVPIHKDQLAYVMYTSGSTGLPKGVAVEHGPLTHHMQNTSRVYGMSAESRELPFLPFSSDGGHERWMNPLMEGGSIILPDQPLWTPEETLTAMRKHGANNASIPTTYLQQLAEWADLTDGAPPMRLYSFGGEALPQQTFELLSRALKSKTLINGYGPTETIMTPLVWRVQAGETFEGTYAPIGRPVGNRRCYVLDPDLNPCPIGVTGELYIGGEGMARGYIGKPDVTADRFIPDPFSKEGGRLYRSGDLTRWRDDGTVEFVGRVDHQVKLRGYRIELGEIETALLDHPSVGEALVVLREDETTRDKMLVAYVVPKQGYEIDVADVHGSLERALPAYMVPSAIMPLAAMPINPNSKLDRFALPAPKPIQRAIVLPANAREEEMLEIWRQVLKLDAISVEDNFFAIGGNSLGAIRILSALRQRKPQNGATIADLFNNPTIRAFAEMAEITKDRPGAEVIVLRATGEKPMLYCFPGLLVSTREYVKLVDYLGAEHPATGFICHSLSENKKVGTTVEEVTQTYVDYIRRHSAGKPCYFLGWSWGGLLAYEAARMLGDDIDLKLMAMIDVCDLGTEFALGAKPSFRPGEREALHAAVTEWLGRTKMRAEWDRLLGVMDADTYDQFLRFVGDEKDPLPADGPDISSREHTFWILIDNALVFRHHKMLPFDAPIHSWAADDSLNRGLNLIDWRRYSPRANPAEIISGTNHLHVIGSQAFHSRLAGRLREALDK